MIHRGYHDPVLFFFGKVDFEYFPTQARKRSQWIMCWRGRLAYERLSVWRQLFLYSQRGTDGVVVVVVDHSQSTAKQKPCTHMLMYARYMPEQANPHLVMPLGCAN
jgi:hypothetical protein